MTVKELIEILQDVDPDMEVTISCDTEDAYYDLVSEPVKDAYINGDVFELYTSLYT